MKISYNWLKQFLKIDWDSNRTAELLTDLGLEVEGISPFESIKGGLKGIVVGEVLSCVKHPNADKLKLTTVNIGLEAPVQIVCGAPNVEVGQKVAVATIGTTLYTVEGEAWKIKKGKIRGEESHGMICAEDELGLGEGHDGIMVLPDGLKVGTPCSEVFEVELDEVFEIGLTPNRADAMSHYGVARDLKAGFKQRDIHKELITPPVTNFNIVNRSLKIDAEVIKSELAPRYCGITISNLIVQPSPDWLKNRLRAIGITPKNNVVDATNYVLHELGQPLHAFDAAKIKGNKIVIKTLPKGTQFTTLDGVQRTLGDEDLMICDTEKPLCIAGVLGGQNSGVTESTSSIFLESAFFNPVSIRKTAKRHGINTDASFRFERGIDIDNVEYCLKRAALLIHEIAGGDITSEIVDIYPKKKDDYHVFLTFDKINKLIGQEIPKDTIKSILASLDIKVKNVTESGLGLSIPFYRVDVQREVDVIEEILRVFGYNNVEFKEKLNASIAPTSKFEDYKIQNIIGNYLASNGFNEILANSLTSPTYNKLSKDISEEHTIAMLNPLSTDLSVMRQSMLFSGLEVIAHNSNRQMHHLKIFEFGKTYHQYPTKKEEKKHLSILITGNRLEDNWTTPPKKVDFFYLKEIAENLLNRLGLAQLISQPTSSDTLSEGISLLLANKPIVGIGVVKKSILKEFDIKEEVLYADFDWDYILEAIVNNKIIYKDIPKYPEVKRDYALLVDEQVSFKQIYDIALETERKFLTKVNLFDVYNGKNLPEGKKSYAVSYTLQDENGTLTDKQIDNIMNKLLQRYKSELGAELR
ncbi:MULTISPECIES: phenylalanine--tRNA ligase subunit beta [unclassified Arenibacter]|uniref:phenylalanine--tRNA ligase subunit beta n=1 Tax=unclassified Arenibacter TaxID=2615047 RepID=UPI000E3516B7|nr:MULTISPECIES: phenylalanine--tRNA ligase subunit beta [unclassified Arenibacter]MCM4163467.1 phenylalanine--tRNA ligase subunit beta [Arenibacter sp. A80]RFT57461.1 phenylalanine--tRNA ligase subunit beta [Arenibacter sp. P308M17]